MALTWIHWAAIASLAVAALCAVIVAGDVVRHPQKMWIMNVVWPVTALFGGPLTLIAYRAYGRATLPDDAETPFPVSVGKGAAHCGSGCTLGDICAEWFAFFVPAILAWLGLGSIFSEKIFAVWVLDYILAFLFGVAFQYFTIKPMRDLTPGQGIVAALKADALSLTAWQVGMYGFMALAHFWLFGQVLGTPLKVDSVEFWFMMQIAMLCGFVTAFPVNWWLIRTGVKEAM